MSRRDVLALFGAAAATSGLAACGASTSTPESLALAEPAAAGGSFSGANLNAILRPAFPNVQETAVRHANEWSEVSNATVNLDFHDEWIAEAVRVANSQAGADIGEFHGSAPLQLADHLVDVSHIAEEATENLGPWLDFARQATSSDGVWRAIPWAYISHAINYRQDILDQIGRSAPETFDDLLETATLLRESGLPQAGFSMSPNALHDSGNFAYSLLWSFGGQEVDETGSRVVLDSAGTRAALQYFRELSATADPAVVLDDEFANNNAFLEERTSMTQNAPSIYYSALDSNSRIATAMNHAPYPAGPNGSHQLVELNSLGIFRHSRNIEAAESWVRHAILPKHAVERTSESLAFFAPPVDGLRDDPGMPWNTDEKLSGLKSFGEGAHMTGWPGPTSVESTFVFDNGSIVRMFAGAASGTESIDELVRTASDELARVYET